MLAFVSCCPQLRNPPPLSLRFLPFQVSGAALRPFFPPFIRIFRRGGVALMLPRGRVFAFSRGRPPQWVQRFFFSFFFGLPSSFSSQDDCACVQVDLSDLDWGGPLSPGSPRLLKFVLCPPPPFYGTHPSETCTQLAVPGARRCLNAPPTNASNLVHVFLFEHLRA